MSYLLQRTESGRFAPNQEEHYPEFLPSSRSSSVQVEDSVTESIPDAPPSYQEALAETPTDSFITATSESQQHISRNLREEITQEISVFLEKITKLEETIFFTRSVPVEEFNYEGWSDVDQGSEWDEEPSGSTYNKEDFQPSLLQVEQENPSVATIQETPFKSYAFEWRFLLVRIQLSEGDVVTFLDPCLDLVDGKVRIEDFPLINVCLIEDFFYLSDNRRLYCFKEAIKRGLDVDRIPVRIRREVVVSPSSRNGRVVDGEGYWETNVDEVLQEAAKKRVTTLTITRTKLDEILQEAKKNASVDKILADVRSTLPLREIKSCEVVNIYNQALNFSFMMMILFFLLGVMLGVMLGIIIHMSIYAKHNSSELKELYEVISGKNKHFYYKF
ncbi:5045_t:CDS:2 [Dentiscutata erythropus]|uniref:5045_t:CDS:1 n=1 Tax=Dentiscutata erythropus TaxID=1348616 RepID=A0A9N9FKD7_9GLOM|nr:5045_t:CDS:2 [Dentiscutata erythropus]